MFLGGNNLLQMWTLGILYLWRILSPVPKDVAHVDMLFRFWHEEIYRVSCIIGGTGFHEHLCMQLHTYFKSGPFPWPIVLSWSLLFQTRNRHLTMIWYLTFPCISSDTLWQHSGHSIFCKRSDVRWYFTRVRTELVHAYHHTLLATNLGGNPLQMDLIAEIVRWTDRDTCSPHPQWPDSKK